MSVNNLSIEQTYELLGEITRQATGENVLTPTDLSSFISVGQKALGVGYDPLLNAISQVLERTLFAVRPYDRKFKTLAVTNDRFGAITRKINFSDSDAEVNEAVELVDGEQYSPWEIKKPKVLQMNFVGSDTWADHMTIFRKQLDVAFRDPSELARFFESMMLHFSNLREKRAEELARASVCNAIAGANALGHTIHLITEYNEETGKNYDATTIKDPAVMPAFVRWAYARLGQVSALMTERSQLFQQVINGYRIMRHTPVSEQRIYLNSDFLNHFKAEVKAITYNDSYLNVAEHEAVNFWQAIESPLDIKTKPALIDENGEVTQAEEQDMTNVIGVIFDKDAVAYNIYQDTLEASPYNPRSESYNLYHKSRVRYSVDFTEKIVTICLD